MGQAFDYRTSALPPPSRRAIAFGTGERLILRLPMPRSEVVQALSRLVQRDKPSPAELSTGRHLPFHGEVRGSNFKLKSLRSKTKLLDIAGEIKADGNTSVVEIYITLRIRSVLAKAVIGLSIVLFAFSRGLEGFVYASIYVVAAAVTLGIAAGAAVRVGIGRVRNILIAGLVPGAATESPRASA